jgi:hypothetical protein
MGIVCRNAAVAGRSCDVGQVVESRCDARLDVGGESRWAQKFKVLVWLEFEKARPELRPAPPCPENLGNIKDHVRPSG